MTAILSNKSKDLLVKSLGEVCPIEPGAIGIAFDEFKIKTNDEGYLEVTFIYKGDDTFTIPFGGMRTMIIEPKHKLTLKERGKLIFGVSIRSGEKPISFNEIKGIIHLSIE